MALIPKHNTIINPVFKASENRYNGGIDQLNDKLKAISNTSFEAEETALIDRILSE
ncbi:MAG: hypothetical protein PUC53_08360 [Bacteroidales bacterium]|nr:hypothetical protein [Bacteroidales bacterium]